MPLLPAAFFLQYGLIKLIYNSTQLIQIGILTMRILYISIIILITIVACKAENNLKGKAMDKNIKTESIVLGGGCFWCVEAVFDKLKGVADVLPGYSGGKRPNPTYDQVCSGATGHAEVCRIDFDPNVIKLAEILEIFFATHDPTTIDRQGADVGSQYRSVIFYNNEDQKLISEEVIMDLNNQSIFSSKIVTEVKPLEKFWEAESYHNDYFKKNPNQPYCSFVISPKVEKLIKKFKDKVKD